MVDVVVYSTEVCSYCIAAKNLLKKKGVSFREIRIDLQPEQREIMIEKSGRKTVPQIFIDDVSIGGFDNMAKLDQVGTLNHLLGL